MRQLSLERARERSRFLRVFRWVCVSIAAGSLGALILMAALHSAGGGFRPSGEIADQEALTIRNPRFTGRDASGNPFMVTALTAVRRGANSPIIDLNEPRYQAEDGRMVVAVRGVYDTEARTLELRDNVLFSDGRDQVFRTQSAFIDARRDLVTGANPVAGAGPLGEIRADSYELKGGRVRLQGRVRGVITPSEASGGEP